MAGPSPEPTAADPTQASLPSADPEDREAADDAWLIRRVRRRLVLWSGGTTLLVLLALGATLYMAAQSTLASFGMAQLQNRVEDFRPLFSGPANPDADGDRSPADFVFGAGGTIAYAFLPDGRVVGRQPFTVTPDQAAAGAAAAASDGQDVRYRAISVLGPIGTETVDVPVRQLTVKLDSPTLGSVYVQALQDRTSELRTLETLVVVLVIGGVIVVLVAVGFGWFYARRALVPIRDSLAGQRAALRRQREFAADASHELRTPLTVIRSSVAHLRRHASEPVAAVGDALEDIDAEVEHLTAMVGDLLLLARSDSGAISLESVPVELDDVATDAAAALRGPAEARQVTLLVDPEPAPTVGDPIRLRQLVTVLVDNAIRHSPSGGQVGLTVRRIDDRVVLAVEDDGPGIRPEDLLRVFDRFWRAASEPSGGTGLGLAIAKWVAEQHGGTIAATNRPDGGARFEVSLPARGVSAAVAPPSPVDAPDPVSEPDPGR